MCMEKTLQELNLQDDFLFAKVMQDVDICTYDPFDAGRHIYTFEHICLEDQEIHLDDQTTRIFLNTEGTLQDVSDDMLALLSYIKQSTKQIAVESGSKLV